MSPQPELANCFVVTRFLDLSRTCVIYSRNRIAGPILIIALPAFLLVLVIPLVEILFGLFCLALFFGNFSFNT